MPIRAFMKDKQMSNYAVDDHLATLNQAFAVVSDFVYLDLEDTADVLCDIYPDPDEREKATLQYTHHCRDAKRALAALAHDIEQIHNRLLWACENP